MEKYFGLSSRIAQWKEDNPFENLLSQKAGIDPVCKHLYAMYYRHCNEKYYDKGKEFARKMFEDHPDDFIGLNYDEVYEDMIYCLHRWGYSFQDYCIYNFIGKSDYERVKFVADKMRYHYCDILNSSNIEEIMTDKWVCYQTYKPFYRRKVLKVEFQSDKTALMELANEVLAHKLIFKPLREHSGHGIRLIDCHQIEDWFYKTIIHDGKRGIVEELIDQGAELAKINPNSVNSCRVMTFCLRDRIVIVGATLRMGVGDSAMDNAGSGGIYASVNPEYGYIQTDAQNYKNQHFAEHPTTKIRLCGYQLPEWDAAKELVSTMARHIVGTTLIAWDIAYSDKGWCLVEANDNGDWSILQSNRQMGLKKELFSLMDDYFNQK